MNLSKLFREGSSEEHSKAEKSKFIQAMFRGHLTKEAYIANLEAMFHLYSTLEAELEKHKEDKNVSKIFYPELFRKKSLEEDLFFFGGNSYNLGMPSKNTIKYANWLKEISKSSPKNLISHAYVRYLGDLSGGQILGKIIRKTFNLHEGYGDLFFKFPIDEIDQFKNLYRSQLDSLDITDQEKQELLHEVKIAFQLNGEIFSDLDEYLLTPTKLQKEVIYEVF
jgi:heme oxygenase (biliverdin-producing, ferredoxin)